MEQTYEIRFVEFFVLLFPMARTATASVHLELVTSSYEKELIK